jgi:hypothetical protein
LLARARAPFALIALGACLPSYTISEGSGGGTTSATVGTGGGTTTASTSVSTGTGDGGPCLDTSCDPLHCGPDLKNCEGGACVKGICGATVFADMEGGGRSIVANDASVYWNDLAHASVSMCPAKGCDPGGPTFLSTMEGDPRRVALAGGYLYWTGSSKVQRTLADGSGPVLLVYSTLHQALGLASDPNYIYFSFGNAGTDGALTRCPFDVTGCGVNHAFAMTYVSGRSFAIEAIAAAPLDVFWVESDGNVYKCPLDGCSGAPTQVAHDATRSLAVDDAWFYFGASSAAGGVYRCPFAGCGPGDADRQLVSATGSRASSVMRDGTFVYWTEQGTVGSNDGSVHRAGVDGSSPTLLADQQWTPVALAANNMYVFWLDAGDEMLQHGAVMRMVK